MLKSLKYSVLLGAMILLNACGTKQEDKAETPKQEAQTNSLYTNDCKSYYDVAIKQDSIIMNAVDLDTKVGNAAIKAFTDFSFYCGKDTLAPVFLLKASEIATSINNLPQAQLCLEKCISDFPDFNNRGAVFFLLARLYDEPTQLNNEAKAEELYHTIKSQFPNTPWAKDADAALLLIGKSDAEIIKEFNKKNKSKK